MFPGTVSATDNKTAALPFIGSLDSVMYESFMYMQVLGNANHLISVASLCTVVSVTSS